jgi:hypothetical protein
VCRNLYATATSEQYQNIHIPGQRTSAIDGDPSSYQVTTTDLVGSDGLLYVAARTLLFNLLTDETDTETTPSHTWPSALTWLGELSATSRHDAKLTVLLPCSIMWTSQTRFWLLQDISLPPVVPRHLARPLDTLKARIARRRSQLVLIRAV